MLKKLFKLDGKSKTAKYLDNDQLNTLVEFKLEGQSYFTCVYVAILFNLNYSLLVNLPDETYTYLSQLPDKTTIGFLLGFGSSEQHLVNFLQVQNTPGVKVILSDKRKLVKEYDFKNTINSYLTA